MDFGPIRARATGQHALITFDQLLGCGITRHQVDRLSRQGMIVRLHRGVFMLAGADANWERRLRAAVLATAPDSWIASRSALAWLGVRATESIEILTTSTRRVRLEGVRAHQTIDLPAVDRRVHRGLPVIAVERSLIDAGRHLGPKQIGSALDHAVRDHLTTYERFERRVAELARQGRDGIGTARLVLADRGYGDGFGFEKAMRGLLRDAGLPAPKREFKVHVGGHRYRVDFAYPDSMVGIECDSTEWHGLHYQREYDLARQNRIQNEGLVLMRYTVARLRTDRTGVRDEIVDAVTRRAGRRPALSEVFPDVEPS